MKQRMKNMFPVLLLLAFVLLLPLREAPAERKKAYTRTWESYAVPKVTLVNQDGVKVDLGKLLIQQKPVMVDFIYTTCTTICPVLSANFTNFQRTMESQAGSFQLVSISIDPEHDTPKEMKAYLKRYRAKPGWDFLTGSRKDIDAVIRAFDALSVNSFNKMEHYPLILLKSPSDTRWVRIYGLIGTTELLKEYEGAKK